MIRRRPSRPSSRTAHPAGGSRPSRCAAVQTGRRRGSAAPFRLVCLACLLIVLLAATPLRAEGERRFSVLVPSGWQATEPSAEMLVIRSPDGDAAAVFIRAALTDKRTARDVLEEYVRYFSASEPQERKEGGHVFTFTRNDECHTCLFLHEAGSTLLLIVSDPGRRYPECLGMIMDSLALHKTATAP